MRVWVACAGFALFLAACLMDSPATSTSAGSELDFNYWLLGKVYFFDDLPENTFTTTAALYAAIPDKYTRYSEPSEADSAETSLTTSVIPGGIGITLASYSGETYPLKVYRVYPESPAERSGVPRYATLLDLNGTSLEGDTQGAAYTAALNAADSVYLTYAYEGDTLTAAMKKETIYAPTVFLDTLTTGHQLLTITEFASSTYDRTNGTVGELKTLASELDLAGTIVLDLRSNPGGNLSQCIAAADVFIESGTLLQIQEKLLYSSGESKLKTLTYTASAGGAGEGGSYLLFFNSGTASCGEVFSMALMRNSATVETVGTTTYGKGIGQSVYHTQAGGLAVITTMQLYDAEGETYHGVGLAPDYECETANSSCLYSVLSIAAAKRSSGDFEILEQERRAKLAGAFAEREIPE